MMSNRPGVFSAGDCVSGPASVIGAIAGGRKAAEAIDKYLGGSGNIDESLVSPEEAVLFPETDQIIEKQATTVHLDPVKSISSFEEVEKEWATETAIAEAQRCLRCNVIAPVDGKLLQDANCQFCGACVDVCPTGALMERSAVFSGTIEKTVKTTCPYCGVGCQIELEVKDNKVINVVPSDGPSNKGQVCVKGKFGQEFVNSPERLTTPLIKKNGQLVPSTWEEAIELIASKFSGYKPEETAVISSSRTSNEDNYVTQKFARAVLGTNNVDNCARV
jgi:predicted molibdopterin-dependent oxidoreductase YjgC